MRNIRVCALFRPLNEKEKSDHGDSVCITGVDSESFIIKDEKQEEIEFCFDRVFHQRSKQDDIYEFVALPIVRGVVNGVNGAIITYGQTGAGKTYTMEGPNLLDCEEKEKGLLPRVVDGIFDIVKRSDDMAKYIIKLSMVEIYMERVRDLFDLSKDHLQIKESREQGIFVSGVTECLSASADGEPKREAGGICLWPEIGISILAAIFVPGITISYAPTLDDTLFSIWNARIAGKSLIPVSDSAQALHCLSSGIANRAVGHTQMNMASSRSHCVYIFSIQQEMKEKRSGKLILVDLAGSEKADKTGAVGRVLEEAKTINKSLSALGNVINALTCASTIRGNHIPYRDSKLTRILQDALGGDTHTTLLCCCSPSPSNASETLSTLRFGSRARHVKASALENFKGNEDTKSPGSVALIKDESCERILEKMRQRMKIEDVQLLEQLFILEGIFFNPNSIEESKAAYEDAVSSTISSLQEAVKVLTIKVEELKNDKEALAKENKALKNQIIAAQSSPFLSRICRWK
ncbi:Kinesin heavy chain [Dorcoceras hygrometricum]|uniref:Kinesin-like protein n=1 Tax=Dorcoceras hygrometricum TaxID=472368 RepID=A0A2Z7CRM3_9LAMI|nr:Kinesin heavy chain [Dorcoceras hygrometricum]